jgi:hypothetical protein
MDTDWPERIWHAHLAADHYPAFQPDALESAAAHSGSIHPGLPNSTASVHSDGDSTSGNYPNVYDCTDTHLAANQSATADQSAAA